MGERLIKRICLGFVDAVPSADFVGAAIVVMGFSFVFVSVGTRFGDARAFLGKCLFVYRCELINDRRTCLADDFILRISASGATDRSYDHSIFDQRNAASRRNDSIER